MKIFMHWDMEGVSGLFTREHVWFWEPETNPRIREEGVQLLMADVNSAAKAALAAGADELLICDTHGGGGNFRLAEMLQDRRIRYLLRSRVEVNGKMRWMAGLDSCDGLMLMGHHAMAGTAGAFLPHTWSGEWADFKINSVSVGEMGIEGCYAGHWNVPVILAHGDEAACNEAARQFPGVVTAAVKRAVSRDIAVGADAEDARQLTASKVTEAIAGLKKVRPRAFKPQLPITVTIQTWDAESASRLSQKAGITRAGETCVQYLAEQACDVVKLSAKAGFDLNP